MQSYSNKHLIEVMCHFNFIPSDVVWDIGYFGQFFDKISLLGFTEREEKKGLSFEFSTNSKPSSPPKVNDVDPQMIFRDPKRRFAITMGERLLSFHIVSEYKDWESFNTDLMVPFMGKYLELGIYNQILSCQVTYLNTFNFNDSDVLSEYFQIVSPPLKNVGTETMVNVSKNYLTNNGIVLITRLLPQSSVAGEKKIMVECGALGQLDGGFPIENWKIISSDVRQPIRNFFESIITTKLRGTL
jgi:uncharacterized protein (TIGR04255 family)